MRKNMLFICYLIAGIVLGSLVAALAVQVSWLAWLGFGVNVGFGAENPAILDLSVLRIAFGINISVSVAHVAAIAAAMFFYHKRRK